MGPTLALSSSAWKSAACCKRQEDEEIRQEEGVYTLIDCTGRNGAVKHAGRSQSAWCHVAALRELATPFWKPRQEHEGPRRWCRG